MSTKEKLIARFKNLPSDFTFEELIRLLGMLGYEMKTREKPQDPDTYSRITRVIR